jgi:hypothetical protein
MARIEWDSVGERRFEVGVDRGVFYTPHETTGVYTLGPGCMFDSVFVQQPTGFPWNGLISVDVEEEGGSTTPIYFDGQKIMDVTVGGDFSGTLKAFTFPDEFIEFDGFSEMGNGAWADNQPRDVFGLSWRTMSGTDLNSSISTLSYKLHILYNVLATPDGIDYQTIDSNISPIVFGWKLTSTPEQIDGMRPTAHIVLDSTKINATTLQIIEEILYGTPDGGSA